MMYIGVDVHSSNCNFSVMDKNGVEIDSAIVETNGRLLIDYIRSIEGPKKLVFEECELSQWLHDILANEVDDLIMSNPVANREYKRAKTDKIDARRLAKLLRGGFITPVYHDGSSRERFRSLMSGYQDVIEEAVRLKNRYKSLHRKNGTRKVGKSVYGDENLLEDFDRSDYKFIGTSIFSILEKLEEERQKYVEEILRVSKGFKEVKYLKTIPGVGDIGAAKIVAGVIDPQRFANKYKYYSYCGLVRHRRISGGKEYGSKKAYGNRMLKCVYKMAADSILRGNSGLRRYYDRLRSRGVSHSNAKNAVSRKVAAISLSLWKHKKRYDDKITDNPLK